MEKTVGKGIQSFPYAQAKPAMALHTFKPYKAKRSGSSTHPDPFYLQVAEICLT